MAVLGPSYADMARQVLFDLGRSTGDSRITNAKILTYLTQARHIIQTEKGVVETLTDFSLNSPTDGTYKLASSIKSIESINLSTDSNFSSTQPVFQVPYSYYEELLNGASLSQDMIIGADVGIGFPSDWNALIGSPVVAANLNNLLFFWPKNTPGFVRLKYRPHCSPYAASDVINWPGYGLDPTSAMENGTLEQVLLPAYEGIIAFAKYNLALSFADELRTYAPLIPSWKQDWEDGKMRIHRMDVQRKIITPSRVGLIP